jgi:hypothetical protein
VQAALKTAASSYHDKSAWSIVTLLVLQDGCFQLDQDFLVNVLQHVPDFMAGVLQHVKLQQRLGSCSLVCRDWHSAAAAATRDVSITLPLEYDPGWRRPQMLTSLEAWLRKHGRQARSLEAAWGEQVDKPGNRFPTRRHGLHLPCQQLGQLQT